MPKKERGVSRRQSFINMSKIDSEKRLGDEAEKPLKGNNHDLANIKDYLSENESKAISRQKSDQSKRSVVKKMTSLMLDSSDRENLKEVEGVEAVAGRIITTIKK